MDYITKLADALDKLRIFPRVFMGSYIWLLIEASDWFLKLDPPTLEQAGYMSVLIGAGIGWLSAYVNSGRNSKNSED